MNGLVKPVGIDGQTAREMYRAAVRRYYRSHSIKIPFNLERKEFGVGDFGKKIVRRYLTFKTSSELRDFLQRYAPLYVSYSVADWEQPAERDDKERGFLGAELVYEFDDDEFVRYAANDISYCKHCNDYQTVGDLIDKGLNPLICINCGNRREIIPLPSEAR
ncbi:TPA: hypothetical protein EYP13_02075, partial [Candidatus Micrarchaeota archaeon]|nr:hypothetical protein [Candidatus Micrarchaeota archaeon]